MTDASTSAQRTQFCMAVEAGRNSVTLAAAVANCTQKMPDATCSALDMPMASIFAAGAAKIAARAAGHLSVY